MADKKTKYQINKIDKRFSNKGSRDDVRRRVIEAFMLEKPGCGRGADASRYNYYVETLLDARKIVLTRPANLKNGFDFLIRVENTNFAKRTERKRDYPKHDDILNDLSRKKRENSKKYSQLFSLIVRTYNCEDLQPSMYTGITFNQGFPVDLILYVVKWFFIEQDIRYWNYSGRQMFMSSVPEP